ncbi:conserved hypothetical protein [Leishmania major strain Friedlin]|uniref:Uncharacterized protein n=1 Tax=Leishmania major TaxID=5664 RepID=Q4Q8R3_LEIMA|nr:conserved hypothetical protein [Leishmania major strain Friedlin]CAG9577030.1 hypothetical_protein_-_conserved [Leishmania major strain Friedlin]CAJ04648.1 conserved hypothetical protein [Leishmania major strain Friedlin]|eukprot:XP_001684285.1 conserved hypothetical protein [Leishmania major strain Friedlin]
MHELRRSASSIATELWSPDELYKADPQVDILQPSSRTLEVDSNRFYAFRLSLVLAPFEALERYQAPQGEGTDLLVDDDVFDVTCTEMQWGGRPDVSTMGIIAEQCKTTSWFRFSSTLSRRLFVVDRSAVHVQTLVAALRYSFSHLLFPADAEMCEGTCTVLFEFIVHHWSRLSGFLPLLYFLFELQERAFLAFYKQLGNLVQMRVNSDIAACDALKPKKSGTMFSWFSSKPKEAELGVNDKLEIIDTLKSMLPPAFEKRYMLALVNHEHLRKMQLFCREYVGSLKQEASTYQALAEGFATYPLTSSPVKGWHPTSALEALAKENSVVKKTMTSVQRFALRKSSLASELVLPYLRAISKCEWEIGIIAHSLVAFYEDLVMRAKRVSESTMLLSGEVPLPPGCEASTRPESLENAREVNQRLTLEFVNIKERFEVEVAHAEAAIKTRMRRLCILCGSVVKAIASCTNAEYYEEYLCSLASPLPDDVTDDCRASHPLKECLGVVEGQEESIYAMDREGA